MNNNQQWDSEEIEEQEQMLSPNDVPFPLADIAWVALTEEKEVISCHRTIKGARKVPGVEYIRPANYEWYDATQPDHLIDLQFAFRIDVDRDDAPDRDEYADNEDMYPCIYIIFGNSHAFCESPSCP